MNGRDLANGVAGQMFARLAIFAAVIVALTALAIIGLPWVWSHVSITII